MLFIMTFLLNIQKQRMQFSNLKCDKFLFILNKLEQNIKPARPTYLKKN